MWRPPSSASDGGLDALERHFARLSEIYVNEVPVPERSIHGLGQRLLRESKPAEARAVFEANVSRYPQSPNVYDNLGQALQALGDPEAAREQFARAIALAEEIDHPSLGVYRSQLEQTNGPGQE